MIHDNCLRATPSQTERVLRRASARERYRRKDAEHDIKLKNHGIYSPKLQYGGVEEGTPYSLELEERKGWNSDWPRILWIDIRMIHCDCRIRAVDADQP